MSRLRNANLLEGKKRYGSLENELDKCAMCGHSHNGDVCDDCDCRIFVKEKKKT